MKYSFNVWWISTYVGVASAFSPHLAHFSQTPLRSRNDVPSSTDVSIQRKYGTMIMAKKSPQPPDYLPRVDEQLELDLMDSERRVNLYEMEVEMIREQLDLKQSELLEEQNLFRDEKRSLMGKIAEFTTILAQRDKELASAMEKDETTAVDLEKQTELENTIRSLESQLKEKTESLENEIESSRELRRRFDNAEDALEFEQMNFEKERRLLQELVTNERKQVKALQDKFDENGKSFKVTREELLSKIQSEEKKLSDTKAKWRATQEQLQNVEKKLETSLREKAQLLEGSKMDADTEKAAMSDEIVNLRNLVKKQHTKMEEMQTGLKKESQEFEKSKNTLESEIEAEERIINDLQEELVEEQKKEEAGRLKLNLEIESINANLANVESQLASERANFSKEKEMLEKKLANEIRVGRLKKKQMKQRYDEIRSEMTGLWESSKRQARQEENRLRKKYKRKLGTVQAQVANLETELMKEKKRLSVEQNEMQSRHAEELKKRDVTISKLEGSVVTLGKLIADKDQIIKEKNERIQRYETSFRQVAKLGLVVTRNKIRRVAGPLKRLVQNSPPDGMD